MTKRCTIVEPRQVDSNDVYYSGEYLPNLNVNTQATLTTILQAIDTIIGNVSGSQYIIKGGNNTQVADGLTLTFNIPHTLGSTPDTYSVEASNQASASNFSVMVNSTNLIITYSIAPSEDTPLSWSWQVIKI